MNNHEKLEYRPEKNNKFLVFVTIKIITVTFSGNNEGQNLINKDVSTQYKDLKFCWVEVWMHT